MVDCMVDWSSKHHHVLLLQLFSECVALPCCAANSKCVKAEIHVMWQLWWTCTSRIPFLFPLHFLFLENGWAAVLRRGRDIHTFLHLLSLYFCSLSDSIYGLSEISNAWRNRHLLLPPAPVCVPSQSQFLSGLSFRLSPSPVLCQAGRLVLWGQTKGWASLRPVSRSANRHHGSLGRRHQARLGSKGISNTHTCRMAGRQGLRKTMADGLNKSKPWCTTSMPPSSKGACRNLAGFFFYAAQTFEKKFYF